MRPRWAILACSGLSILLAITGCEDNGTNPNPHQPAASFMISPSTGTTVTVFQFDASASTDEEDPSADLEVRWDWENDGTWDTEFSTTKSAGHQYATVGMKTIMLEVRDTGGLTDKATRTVEVSAPNLHAPVAAFTVTPAGGDSLTTFHFDASASTDAEDPSASLLIRWDWEDDGIWDTEYSTVKTADHRYETSGTRTVRLEVKDSGELTDTVTHTVNVQPCLTPHLSEDFETPASFASVWQVMDGTVAVEAGGFGSGSYWAHGHATGENDAAILLKSDCALAWSNYTLECDVKIDSNDAWNYAMIYFYVQSPDGWSFGPHDGYELVLKSYYDNVQLTRRADGRAVAELGLAAYTIDQGTKYHVKIVVQNPTIAVYVNGTPVLSVQDTAYTQGTVALSGGTGGGAWTYVDSYYDNVSVTATGAVELH